MPRSRDPKEYIEGIRAGNRVLLSRAITFIESSLPRDQELASEIIEGCLPFSGRARRVGISGIPGVGKSTFIEAFGKYLLNQGRRVAVLAVDPSSSRHGGSILGDKARMVELSADPRAYIRPSPAGRTLGGVARYTREAMFLCEAAGFDTILVETVGVGQSETAVHSMVDFFLLLLIAGAGDELQGIKRGIMEMADLISINKADGPNKERAESTRAEFANAVHFFPPADHDWPRQVITTSALNNIGMDLVWEKIDSFFVKVKGSGWLERNRARQREGWLRETVQNRLLEDFYAHPEVGGNWENARHQVREGKKSPFRVAGELLGRYRGSPQN